MIGSAPSLANLEWVDQSFQRDYEAVSEASRTAEFSRYRNQLTGLLADSKTLHEYARERCRISLTTDRREALLYSAADLQAEASLGQTASVLERIKHQPDDTLAKDTLHWQGVLQIEHDKWDKVLSVYSNDQASVFRYAEDPAALKNLMRDGLLQLQTSRSLLAQGDPLGAWISVVHADLLIRSIEHRLLGYYEKVFRKD